MRPPSFDDVERINNIYHQLNKDLVKIWLNEMLFTWRAWVSLALLVLPWVFWILIRKRESTHRLLYAGILISLISTYLDNIGMAMGLWGYPFKLIPLVPPFLPWDVSIIPVFTMIALQFMPHMNKYIKAILFSAFGSFVLQPFSEWLGLYYHKVWQHYYSLPFGIILYLIAHYVLTKKSYKEII